MGPMLSHDVRRITACGQGFGGVRETKTKMIKQPQDKC